jgi:hypothetical protein
MDLFLHIPKTAGLTVSAIANRNYPLGKTHMIGTSEAMADFLMRTQDERDRLMFVSGHFSYGFHRNFSTPCRYVTMLRDPCDAMVSLYHYILHRPDHRYHRMLIDDGVGFTEWLSSNSRDHLDNHQVRWLVGRIDEEPIGRADLEHARHIIERECVAFGIVERFDESMLLLQDALAWTDLRYKPRNVYRQDGDCALTDEDRGLLAEHHALSLELVAFARGLFEERVRSMGSAFSERLSRFISENEAWAPS